MGYRNQVAIKCEERAYKKIKDVCKNVNNMPDKIYKCQNEKEYILYWDWVKWWNLDNDIKAIENALSELDKLDIKSGYGYTFMRLGEEDGDIEIRENVCYLDLFTTRKIDIPYGFEEIKVKIDKEED